MLYTRHISKNLDNPSEFLAIINIESNEACQGDNKRWYHLLGYVAIDLKKIKTSTQNKKQIALRWQQPQHQNIYVLN